MFLSMTYFYIALLSRVHGFYPHSIPISTSGYWEHLAGNWFGLFYYSSSAVNWRGDWRDERHIDDTGEFHDLE